jgi:putative membrane protein
MATGLLSLLWAWLFYLSYRYEFTKDRFNKESGVISKKYVTIPYSKVQNVDIYRGLTHRLLGLSSLNIHTAGVGGVAAGEGQLEGLSKENAVKLRDELIENVQKHSGREL